MASVYKIAGIGGNWVEKQLGQLRPSDTSAASIYSPPSNIISTQITTIIVCNTTGSSATFRMFLDADGTTYDQTTALYYDVAVDTAVTSIINPNGIFMNNSSGNLAVAQGTGSALTFSVYGIEILTNQA